LGRFSIGINFIRCIFKNIIVLNNINIAIKLIQQAAITL